MEEHSENKTYTQKPAKILLIDDDDNSTSLLKRRLSIYGHEVFPIREYKLAESTLASNTVDVIFLNMFVNGQSSYNFLCKLKTDPQYGNIPVIMVSSNDDIDLIVKCIEAGAEDYLVRPLNQTLLRARLANCISRKEAYDKEIAYLAQIEQGQKQIQAQEKMASLGVLVSSISQELKNPLNFIINFAQVSLEICNEAINSIEKDKTTVSPDLYDFISSHFTRFKSNVGKIYEYGHNADTIIRFMFDQSSTSDGKKYPASINKIITQTISMLLSTYKMNGITNIPKIDTDLDASIPHISVSTQMLSKAIYNILNNSIDSVMAKFTSTQDARITITTNNINEEISITVRDNGEGISEANRDKIFNPFFTTRQNGVRTGLGLSTAKEIINDHNGTISFNSQQGEYAEFTITLKK